MTEATKVTVVATVFSVIATLLVILRMISRIVVLKKSWMDDYLIVLAMLFSWGHTGCMYAQATFGSGKHAQQVPFTDLRKILFYLWLGLPLYNLGLTLAKVSALSQLLRFIMIQSTRMVTIVLIGIVSIYGLASSIVCLLSCVPIHVFWDATGWDSKCINLPAFWYANAAFNVATDIAVVTLPLYVLKDLSTISKRQKVAINAIFMVGAVACVTSILRLHSIYVLNNDRDITYIISGVEMWCVIEINTAISCACMQSLKPLLDKTIPGWRRQDRAASTGRGSSSNKSNQRRFESSSNASSSDPTQSSSITLTDLNEMLLFDPVSQTKLPSRISERARSSES